MNAKCRAVEQPPKIPKKIKWWVKLMLAFAVPVLCALIGLVAYHVYLTKQVEAKLQGLEKAGIPTDRESLWSKLEVIPEEDNAAPLLIEAIAALKVPGKDVKDVLYFPNSPSPTNLVISSAQELAVMGEWVNKNEEMLKRLDEALKKPRCRFTSHGAELSHADEFDYLYGVVDMSRLLALKSYWQACQNDKKGAMETIRKHAPLSGFLSEDPSPFHFTVQLTCDNHVRTAAAQLVKRCELTAEEMDELKKMVQSPFRFDGVKLQLAAEIVKTRAFFDHSPDQLFKELDRMAGRESADEPPALFKNITASRWWLGGGKRDNLLYLELVESMIKALESPPLGSLSNARWVEKKLEEDITLNVKSRLFGKGLLELTHRRLTAEARNRLLLSLIEVEKYRATQDGRIPESLEAIATEATAYHLQDPYVAGWLQIQIKEAGYIIYSVGRDQVDNGGMRKPNTEEEVEYDLVVEMFR